MFLIHLNIRPDFKSLCFLVIFKNMTADFKNVVFWVTDLKETSIDVGVVVDGAVLVVAHNLDRLLMQLCSCAVMQAPGKFGKLTEVEVDALRLTTTQHFLQRLVVFVWIRLTKLQCFLGFFFTFLVPQVLQKCTKDPNSKASS